MEQTVIGLSAIGSVREGTGMLTGMEAFMNGSHFDSWTRRRLGLAAGGLAGLLLGLPGEARKKRRKRRRNKKKRCKKLGQPCTDGGRRCCHGRTCGGDPALGTFCCKQGGEPCKKDGDCCNRQCFQGSCALN